MSDTFKHFCPDFDDLEIDETMQEFEFCLCDFGEENRARVDRIREEFRNIRKLYMIL